jgi:DNA-binding transcriptional regulator YiaG
MSTTDTATRRRTRNLPGARALTARRYSCGLSVPELATRVGVATRTAYAWEQGWARPRPRTYALLLDALGLDEGALWWDEDLEVAQ